MPLTNEPKFNRSSRSGLHNTFSIMKENKRQHLKQEIVDELVAKSLYDTDLLICRLWEQIIELGSKVPDVEYPAELMLHTVSTTRFIRNCAFSTMPHQLGDSSEAVDEFGQELTDSLTLVADVIDNWWEQIGEMSDKVPEMKYSAELIVKTSQTVNALRSGCIKCKDADTSSAETAVEYFVRLLQDADEIISTLCGIVMEMSNVTDGTYSIEMVADTYKAKAILTGYIANYQSEEKTD